MGLGLLFYDAVRLSFEALRILIIIRIVLSFLGIYNNGKFAEFIYTITEPVLSIARKTLDILKINNYGFDFSPVVVFLMMELVENLLGRILY